MEQNKRSVEFNCMAVLNFCRMDPQTLQALAKDLSLSLSQNALFRLQQYYMLRERRDPTVGELRLICAVARHFYQSPQYLRIAGATGDEALQRSLRDVLQKRATMQKAPGATLADIAESAGEFLKRCGIFAKATQLYCDVDAGLAALANGHRPDLAAQLPLTSAALLQQPPKPLPRQGALLLLSPQEGKPFANDVSLFLARVRDMDVHPIALIGDEGLLPHLLPYDGISLDLSAISKDLAEQGPDALLSCGREQLLLLCNEGQLAALRGAPRLSFIGSVGFSGRVQLRCGMTMLASLDTALLREMRSVRELRPLLAASKAASDGITTVAQNATSLLLGNEGSSDPEKAVLALATKAYAAGGVMESATLCPALLLPGAPSDATLERACTLLLSLHRACCELTLPALHPRLLYQNELQEPVLALWLSCAKTAREAAELTPPDTWEEARLLFFGKAE